MLLAICIPTHDGRGVQLRRLLDSLVADVAADDRIEVCVSDNASQDETANVVAEFSAGVGGRVRYNRHSENRGFTANLLQAVELSTAPWCWLLGSDDLVHADGVREVVALVERHPDVCGATLNRNLVSIKHPSVLLRDRPELLPSQPTRERELVGAEAIFRELGQLQDYISTQVVTRDSWVRAVRRAGPQALAQGRTYPHLLLIAMMIRERPRWVWFPREVVQQRIGVSAFFGDGPVENISVYEAGLLADRSAIWADVFGPWSALHRALLRKVWWRHFSTGVLLNHKLDSRFGPESDLRLLRVLPRYFWWLPAFWVSTLPILLVPGVFMRAARPLLRQAKGCLSAQGRRG